MVECFPQNCSHCQERLPTLLLGASFLPYKRTNYCHFLLNPLEQHRPSFLLLLGKQTFLWGSGLVQTNMHESKPQRSVSRFPDHSKSPRFWLIIALVYLSKCSHQTTKRRDAVYSVAEHFPGKHAQGQSFHPCTKSPENGL